MSRRDFNTTLEEPLIVGDPWSHQKGSTKLKLRSKLAYGLGGIPFNITGTVLAFFLSVFLLEVAKLQPYQVSLIAFLGKGFDAITDPLCGYLVNRTETRYGKLKPWILGSTPLACITYILIWYVPDCSDEGKVAYYLVMYCAFNMFLTCYHMPYTTLTMYLSDEQKDRDSATVYRMVFEAFGLLLSVLLQGQIVNKYRVASHCGHKTTEIITPERIQAEKTAYFLSGCVISGIYLICSLLLAYGVTEKKLVEHNDRENAWKSIKSVFSYGPFLKLAVAYLFVSVACQIPQGNLTLYITHSLHLGNQFAYLMLALMASVIFAMPIWYHLVGRFGRKPSFVIGMIILIPCFFSLLFLQSDLAPLYAATVIAGLGIASSLLLPWIMLPDVLDDYLIQTGQRRDSLFYAYYVFLSKLSVGIAIALSQLALQIGGYDSTKCEQSESVGLTLRLLVSPIPTVCALVSLIFIWWYPITEKRRDNNSKALWQQRQGNEKGQPLTIKDSDAEAENTSM